MEYLHEKKNIKEKDTAKMTLEKMKNDASKKETNKNDTMLNVKC